MFSDRVARLNEDKINLKLKYQTMIDECSAWPDEDAKHRDRMMKYMRDSLEDGLKYIDEQIYYFENLGATNEK